jgi:hypothetical protein
MSINNMAVKQHSQSHVQAASLDTQHIHIQSEIIAIAVTCTLLVFLALVTMEVPADNHH